MEYHFSRVYTDNLHELKHLDIIQDERYHLDEYTDFPNEIPIRAKAWYHAKDFFDSTIDDGYGMFI
jgi:hypothetical protein